VYCGSSRNLTIDHVDGHEENNSARNLAWACKSCNTAKGFALQRAGRGRRTRQFNAGSKTLASFEARRKAIERTYHKERKLYGEHAAAGRRDYLLARLERDREKARESSETPLFNAKGKRSGGAKSLAQWVLATMALHGQSNAMSRADAVEMIHQTPDWQRSEYAREIWDRRRARGTDKTSEVPF
jgi:hypothetical protein